MKRRAGGLLVASTVVFVIAKVLEDRSPAWGYVRATAEAAMVGGIADWFAVTALFRRPLGLPIPHTALIPTRKDALGRSLGEFVESNFLAGDAVAERLRSARVAARLARWLNEPGAAATVGRHVSVALAGAADVVRDEDVAGAIEGAVVARAQTVHVAPLAGRAIEIATAEGRHRPLVDAIARGAIRVLDEQQPFLRSRFGRESPWWVPETIDDRIFTKLHTALRGFLVEVVDSPGHEMRNVLDRRLAEFATRLQEDPAYLAKGDAWRDEVLEHPAVRTWIGGIWGDVKSTLHRQSADPSSELRQRLEALVEQFARRLADDVELQQKLDGWLETVVRYVVEQERHQVVELIATTVERWDPAEASTRIELAVGRDLQFIRINGTVVGGLAGLVIHLVGQLLL